MGHQPQDVFVSNGGFQNLKPIQIQTGSAQAWFYPLKGLNELFRWAGKPKSLGIKTLLTTGANPKSKLSSKPRSQRWHTYVEVLKMNAGGDKGKGQQEERPAEGDHTRANNSGAMNYGSSNASKRGPLPPCPNQFSFNPGHDRGRAYGGYVRGWQRQPHRGTSMVDLDLLQATIGSGVNKLDKARSMATMGHICLVPNKWQCLADHLRMHHNLSQWFPRCLRHKKLARPRLMKGRIQKVKKNCFAFVVINWGTRSWNARLRYTVTSVIAMNI
jgi:hypothetical protein